MASTKFCFRTIYNNFKTHSEISNPFHLNSILLFRYIFVQYNPSKVYIFYDPEEVESINAYIASERELGAYLEDAEVGTLVYEAALKYKITEEYKRLVKKCSA